MNDDAVRDWYRRLIFGETVGPDYGPIMEWVALEQAWERLTINTFLARWGDRTGYCSRDGDGGFYTVTDSGKIEDDGSTVTRWSKVAAPDQVLVTQ